MEWERPELPLTVQAELLSLNRTSLYYQPAPPSAEELRLKHRIDELYTLYPFMGSRKITAMLHQEGETVHRNTVQVYMRDMGLAAIYPGPNLPPTSHVSLSVEGLDDPAAQPCFWH